MSRCGDPLDLMEPLGTELARHDPMFSSKTVGCHPLLTWWPGGIVVRSDAPDQGTGQPGRQSSRIIPEARTS